MRTRTTSLRRALPLLGALLLLAASGAASAQSCSFQGAPAGIAFPSLDPSNATVVTASTNVDIKCTGKGVPPPAGWAFSDTYGVNPNLQMKHATLNAFIPYSVANPPLLVTGAGSNQTYQVTATILPASYVNAYAGTYSDTLVISITP
jgi:spore coat protein U-like protein